MSKLSIGIDIGGTFTDIIIQEKKSGKLIKQLKVPTTPKNPEEAIIECFGQELPEEVRKTVQQIYHATTIATNAFLGQVNLELPKTVLITTKGFRDVLEIGRQRRASLYDFFFERPKPIIPRRFRFEVQERLDHTGAVITSLAMEQLQTISKTITEESIASIAVSFLHSYMNDTHEQQIKHYFLNHHPDLYLSLSSEVSPEHREFERTSTTAINAVLMPLVSKYVQRLTESFADFGITAPLFIMQSNGGVSHAKQIEKIPVSIIESGPSAGVVASRFLADFLGHTKILSFDMGGTTAKAGTVINKTISLTSEYEVGGEVHSGRITKGSGYPARFPFIDLAEISSGGGSIAWVDEGRALRVGPISAGSDPGPACYGRGGDDPTITDANVLLGRLNPKGLLGESFTIYPELTEKSIQEKIASPLNLTPLESAQGIIKIANINMSRILRIVTVERGLDPREFILLAFGGAGPLHACALAEELTMKKVLIPNNPGLFSAMGLLYTNVKHTLVKSIRKPLSNLSFKQLLNAYHQLEQQGEATLHEEGFDNKKVKHQRLADLRYLGQGFELLVPLDGIDLTSENIDQKIRQLFNEKHQTIYGYFMDDEDVELVNIRVNSLGLIEKPTLTTQAKGENKPPSEALVDQREVFFESKGDFIQTPIYDRSKLLPRNKLFGPAIIEQYDTTTIVPPGWQVTIDTYGLLQLVRK